MTDFVNVIKRCDDGHPIARDWKGHQGITIHRCGEDHETGIVLGSTAPEISDHFTGRNTMYPEVAQATGKQNAYTIIIGKHGEKWQVLPLSDVGHHARRWSYLTIGVAVIGDPRHEKLSNAQYWALADTLLLLTGFLGTSVSNIQGHDERRGASSDPSKECPGRLLSMPQLRFDVSSMLLAHWRGRVERSGLVL